MNRYVFSLFIMLFIIFNNTNAIIKRTLINFATYDEKIQEEFQEPEESYITNIDGTPKVVVGYKDYLLNNWKVELNDSANNLNNRVNSFCKSVASQRFGPTLGVRVHFPKWANNSYALIKPPFPIKIYGTNGQFINAENGVMPNVAEIRSISVWISGRNFKYGFAIRLRDRFNEIHEFFMGWLLFDGWRKLTFINPNFSEKVQTKILSREPLYPLDVPYYVLDSFVIYRPSDQRGGDFVTYIGSVELEYTPYFVDNELLEDIKDEEVWGIITDKAMKMRDLEDKRLTEEMILYKQEKRRIEIERDTGMKDKNH